MLSKEELKQKLTTIQYSVTQEKDTEIPYANEYDNFFEDGTYLCIVCGKELYSSETKFNCGSGWPAFYDVIDKKNVKFEDDSSLGMQRVEINCACGSHLGHMFDDGPREYNNGTRYCINSASITFKKK